MPSNADIAEFRELLKKLGAEAAGAVATAIASVNVDELVAAYPSVVDPYAAAAATLTAQWYDDLNPGSSFAVEEAPPRPRNVLTANARWALTQNDVVTALQGSAERQVFGASRDTTVLNVNREGVSYVRYASSNACAFCRMLATRGSVFTSERSATRVVGRSGRPRGSRKLGDKYHDFCRCIAVAVRAGDTYEPPDYVKQWEADYNAAAASKDTKTTNDIINHMRRDDYARNKDSINAARRARHAERKARKETVETVADAFQAKYPHIATVFQPEDDLGMVRDFLDGVDHVLTKYPQAMDLDGGTPRIFSAPSSDMTIPGRPAPYADALAAQREIRFNQQFLRDPAGYAESVKSGLSSGFHPPFGDKSKPWQTGVHEMAHILDEVGGRQARNRAEVALLEYFRQEDNPVFAKAKAAVQDMRDTWAEIKAIGPRAPKQLLHRVTEQSSKAQGLMSEAFTVVRESGELSGYSFYKDGLLNPGEAVAEAFADVEANGSRASGAAHVLHRLVEDALK